VPPGTPDAVMGTGKKKNIYVGAHHTIFATDPLVPSYTTALISVNRTPRGALPFKIKLRVLHCSTTSKMQSVVHFIMRLNIRLIFNIYVPFTHNEERCLVATRQEYLSSSISCARKMA
jgi:hypothetical protein